jgi:hypothetical protein
MSMTLDDIAGILDGMEFRYQRRDEASITFWMNMKTYKEPSTGDSSLMLMVQLLENGEYFNLFAPRAYEVKGEHQDEFLRACAMVQWKTKLIQFEWDASDGEVRPTVEFPLEDGVLTRKQFERCVNGMCAILDQYHPVLARAAAEGIVEFDEPGRPEPVRRDQSALIQGIKARLAGRGQGSSGTGTRDGSADGVQPEPAKPGSDGPPREL